MHRPSCPLHPRSTVWFDGSYGVPGRRRQRYKCTPRDGSRAHRFTETLPRERTHTGECDVCERPYGRHEGPPVPRRYDYPIRTIAAVLCRLGEGMPYREAGRSARLSINRLAQTRTGYRYPSNEGSLASGWAEVFADALFDELDDAPDWPDILLLDAQPFRLRGGRGGRVGFTVFGAVGYAGPNHHRIWRLWASHRQQAPDWEEFLTTGPQGMPRIVVCDAEPALLAALRNLWGLHGPTVVLCHVHLEKRLRELMLKHGLGPGDVVFDQYAGAFGDGASWAAWLALARATNHADLNAWLDDRLAPHLGGRSLADQITWQHALTGVPLSAGPLEQHFEWLRDKFTGRRHAFRNQHRTNQLLKLIQLYKNHQANESRYARILRAHLTEHAGTAARRRQVNDPRGTHSLRP